MQKKRAANESIYSNLKQYDLDHLYVDAFVADSSMEGMWRETTLFDAIITDRKFLLVNLFIVLTWLI